MTFSQGLLVVFLLFLIISSWRLEQQIRRKMESFEKLQNHLITMQDYMIGRVATAEELLKHARAVQEDSRKEYATLRLLTVKLESLIEEYGKTY